MRIIETERPTFACAVPTIWNEVLRYAEEHGSDMSSFRAILCGGAAVPRVMIERFSELFGVPIIQGWGMTETSPLGAVALAAARRRAGEARSTTGPRRAGSRSASRSASSTPRATSVLDDGTSVGEFEVRGPWITAEYYDEKSPERFHDGWLRTGDVGHLGRRGLHADHGPHKGRHQDRR